LDVIIAFFSFEI